MHVCFVPLPRYSLSATTTCGEHRLKTQRIAHLAVYHFSFITVVFRCVVLLLMRSRVL